jgi:hypothetical protein
MKTIKRSAMIVAILGIFIIASGCGKKNQDNQGGGGAAVGPGYAPGVVTPIPGGGAAISFSFSNGYYSGAQASVGQVSGSSKCTTQYCFCDWTTQTSFQCWTFANMYRPGGSGATAIGAQMPVGQPGSISAPSKYEPGTGLTIVFTPGVDPLHSNGSGVITLSPQYMQLNYPQGMPAVVGVAIDLVISGGTGFGGVLIYNSQDASGYHGRFLRL